MVLSYINQIQTLFTTFHPGKREGCFLYHILVHDRVDARRRRGRKRVVPIFADNTAAVVAAAAAAAAARERRAN